MTGGNSSGCLKSEKGERSRAMKKIRCREYTCDGIPKFSRTELEDNAIMMLEESIPQHVDKPDQLDPFYFAECVAGANLDFVNIYYRESERPILGMTVFERQNIKVFDKEHLCTRTISVPEDSVIIDDSLNSAGKEGMRSFTIFHEIAHLMLHYHIYAQTDSWRRYDEYGSAMTRVLCRENTIGKEPGRLRTSHDFIEWQANELAADLLMPYTSFVPYVYDLNQKYGFMNGIFWMREGEADRRAALNTITGIVAATYGVSKKSAEVQMSKYGLLTDVRGFIKARAKLNTYIR